MAAGLEVRIGAGGVQRLLFGAGLAKHRSTGGVFLCSDRGTKKLRRAKRSMFQPATCCLFMRILIATTLPFSSQEA